MDKQTLLTKIEAVGSDVEWELLCAGQASWERRTHAVVLDTPAVYDTYSPLNSLFNPGETTSGPEAIVFFNANQDIPGGLPAGEVIPIDDLVALLKSCY